MWRGGRWSCAVVKGGENVKGMKEVEAEEEQGTEDYCL